MAEGGDVYEEYCRRLHPGPTIDFQGEGQRRASAPGNKGRQGGGQAGRLLHRHQCGHEGRRLEGDQTASKSKSESTSRVGSKDKDKDESKSTKGGGKKKKDKKKTAHFKKRGAPIFKVLIIVFTVISLLCLVGAVIFAIMLANEAASKP